MSNAIKNKKFLTLQDTAIVCNVSMPTIKNWVMNQGLPVITRGSKGVEWQFSKEDVLVWFSVHKQKNKDTESLDEAKTRKITAEATLAEIQVAIAKGKLVKIEEVAQSVEKEYSTVRTKMLAISNKVAPQLFSAETLEEIQDMLTDEINQVLKELSTQTE